MNRHQLHTQSYYRLENSKDGCNIKDLSARLIVNCSGVSALDTPFKTETPGGRLDYYLMYVISGGLEASSGEKYCTLSEGDAIIYTPGAGYAYQNRLNRRLVYLWIHFTGSDAGQLLSERGLETGVAYPVGLSEEIERAFEDVHHLFITRPAFYLEESAALLELILTRIGRSVLANGEVSPSERLKASLSHLNRHYAEPLRLETLASMEYLSVSRYSAIFRKIMGISPQKYLIGLRLNNAREMLLSTDLSITEVARSVGYDDALYFSRLFHRHFGLPPRDIRRSRSE